MFIYQAVRKVGNSYMVTIPKEIVEELELEVGHTVALHVQRARVEMWPELSPEVEAVVDAAIEDIGPALAYLGEH